MNNKRELGRLVRLPTRALHFTPTGMAVAIPLPPPPSPFLPCAIMRRTLRLLEMQYKPEELAEELGVTLHTVLRVWIPAGCPYEQDADGQLWIVGTHFRTWAASGAVRRSLPYARPR